MNTFYTIIICNYLMVVFILTPKSFSLHRFRKMIWLCDSHLWAGYEYPHIIMHWPHLNIIAQSIIYFWVTNKLQLILFIWLNLWFPSRSCKKVKAKQNNKKHLFVSTSVVKGFNFMLRSYTTV